MNNVKNSQYAYTNETEFNAGITQNHGYLAIKNGLTFRNTDDRVREQDIASVTAELIILDRLTTYSNDIKLDDKIREVIHGYPNFKEYVRNDHKRGEWTLVKISDILKRCKLPYTSKALKDSRFLSLLGKRIHQAKQKAIKELINVESGIEVILRKQQKFVLDKMLKNDKKYYLLNLAPRLGKTFLILEYMQELSKRCKNQKH